MAESSRDLIRRKHERSSDERRRKNSLRKSYFRSNFPHFLSHFTLACAFSHFIFYFEFLISPTVDSRAADSVLNCLSLSWKLYRENSSGKFYFSLTKTRENWSEIQFYLSCWSANSIQKFACKLCLARGVSKFNCGATECSLTEQQKKSSIFINCAPLWTRYNLFLLSFREWFEWKSVVCLPLLILERVYIWETFCKLCKGERNVKQALKWLTSSSSITNSASHSNAIGKMSSGDFDWQADLILIRH